MAHPFLFNETQFNRLFPFYILINRELQVIALGKSIGKLCDMDKTKKFNQQFSIPRPLTPIDKFEDLVVLENQLVVLESATKKLLLRGQFEFLNETNEVLFVGSPWFGSMEQVRENKLVIDDFARHDPLIDLLHVLKSQEITNEDLQQLISTINKQKNDLKKANKEVHDIALFPTQNPDPLIRIDFNGELLRNNPAAASLDFFDFENKFYRNDEFFKIISTRIDKSNPRWIIEARSGNKDYSFICVSMLEEGYINIYGRDITQQKLDQLKLERLSLVASSNENGVLFTTPEGYITWANEGFCKLTGYLLEELIGKTPIEICKGPLSDETALHSILQSFFKGLAFSTEIIYYRKDGSFFLGRSVSQPIKNSDGKVVEFFGIIQNISKEKESEQRFRLALEHIGDNVWEHDFESGVTYFSKSENLFLGHKTNEFTNNQDLWWSSVYKEDQTMLFENDQKYKNGEINSHNLEYRMIDKGGDIKWVLDRGVIIEKDKNGLPLRIIGTHTDITNVKRTEVELANRVKQFQSLSENIPGVIYEYEFRKDGTDGIRYLSPAIEKIFGIKPEDFKNYHQYIHPDDRALIIQKNQHSRKTLEPFYDESRLIMPGQPIRWHSVHSSFSYRTDNGNDVFTGFMLDITERKNTEALLEKQRKFYEDILNNMPADIAVFSPKHEYLFVNPRGIKNDELRKWIIGKRDEDYCILKNKPLSIAEGRRETFTKVLNSKKPSEWEEKNINPLGDEEYILRRWFPVLDSDSNVTLVIGYGIDITVRKKFEEALRINEEKYRGIIANMNLGLMEMDSDQKINFANQTLLKMTGLAEEEVSGYDSSSFFSAKSLLELNERLNDSARGINEAYEVETNIHNKHGWWLVSTAPKFSKKGELAGYIAICLDISNQKKLERELIKSREQAELLSKAKETFLANMSHEIRTPMNAIMGMGNQLSKTNLSDQQSFYLNTINLASENLLVIINDILDLSKIEAGKLTVEKIGFEPTKVVGNAMRVLMHKAEEKGLLLTNSYFDKRLSNVLIGDPYRLNQVLLNLISNAIKFTEKGTVDITCELIQESAITQIVQVKIIDTGIGMDEDFTKKLFDKFSQEYESVTRRFGGTGLGMSICKELIELMNGSIEVSSKKGKGTTVSFIIEFKKGTQEDLALTVTENITDDFLKGKSILIADDNDMNRLVAATILENYGANIFEAANGEAAVKVFEETLIDLVLMDIQMPKLNGYEASRLIRKQSKNVPIIALTANAIKGENDKCLDAGMNDYISKPFKEDDFLKKIAKCLNDELKTNIIEIKPILLNDEPLYDLSFLKEISQGNQSFIEKMVALFCAQTPLMIEQIKVAYETNQLDTIEAVAHKLKPSIDNLKINSLKQVIRNIEKAGKEKKITKELKSEIDTIEMVINQSIQQMKLEFPV